MEVHPEFRLNGISYNAIALQHWASNTLNKGRDFEKDIATFLVLWLNSSTTVQVYTSGSTGKPKTLLLSKTAMLASAKATGTYFKLKQGTTALLCLSASYIAGKMMLVRALTLGWHLDIVAPKSTLDINRYYDFSAMVPLQLRNSLGSLQKIKTLIVGGGVVPHDVLTQIQKVETQVFATYGMTETITHIAVKKLNHCSRITRKYYHILPNVTISTDERSCLCITLPYVSNTPIKTNDVVELISDTHFEWLGRLDNVINSGGIKLHPELIEKQLEKFIETRFFIAGVQDDIFGQKLILIIEGKEKPIDLTTSGLSLYEIPKAIYFLDRFIETKTKKIQRQKTLDMLML